MSKPFWGPFSNLGLALCALAFGLDQTVKWYLLHVVNMPELKRVSLLPFFDLVMAWNEGISYGLLATNRQAVLIGLSLMICALLFYWLAKAKAALPAAAFGLVIGGALANAFDRLVHGAVADFFYFHFDSLNFALFKFVFNPADVAIFCGVCLLLYQSFIEKPVEARH